MQSWIHVIEWRANVRPELTALVDDRGAAYTYAQLKAATERRAGGWAELLGIGPGDIVAVVAKNSADFLVHAFALMRAGATPAFVNWRLSRRELAEVLALVEPTAIAADAEFAGLVSAAWPEPLPRVVIGGGPVPDGWTDGADTGRPRGCPAAARAHRRHGAGPGAHQRDHGPGQGHPAAARRADDERGRLRHRDRRPGRRVAPPADPAAVPPGRLRPVPAGDPDRRDGLHPHGLQPGGGHRRHRGGPDRVLHRGPVADRHAGGRDPAPRRARTCPACARSPTAPRRSRRPR